MRRRKNGLAVASVIWRTYWPLRAFSRNESGCRISIMAKSTGLNRDSHEIWIGESGALIRNWRRVDAEAMLLGVTRTRCRRVEAGSRHGARRAKWFEVSPSSAIKWMQRRPGDRKYRPKRSGGSISPLEVHADFLVSLIAGRPDLTLDEIVVAMRKRRIAGSRTRCGASFTDTISASKKPCGRRSKSEPMWPAHGGVGCESKTRLTRLDWRLSTRPLPRPTWCGFAAAVGAVCD